MTPYCSFFTKVSVAQRYGFASVCHRSPDQALLGPERFLFAQDNVMPNPVPVDAQSFESLQVTAYDMKSFHKLS